MRSTQLWAMGPDGTRRAVHCHVPIWITPSATTPVVTPATPADAGKIMLLSIEPLGAA